MITLEGSEIKAAYASPEYDGVAWIIQTFYTRVHQCRS